MTGDKATDLERLSTAERMLSEIASAEDAVKVRDYAEAARVYAKKAKLGTAAINHATTIKIRAEVRLANMVDQGQANGQIAERGNQPRPKDYPTKSLKELEVSGKQVHEARQLRDWTDDKAVAAMSQKATDNDEELTRAEMLRQAKAHRRASVKARVSPDHIVLPSTVKVFCRDARDHYPDELADLAIFSPPYPDAGIVYDAETEAIDLEGWIDLISTTASVLVDGWQISRACMVIPSGVGRSPYVPLAGMAWEALRRGGLAPEGEIVWDKATTGNRTSWGSFRLPTEPRLRDRHELVLIGRSAHSQRIPKDTFVGDGDGRSVSPWLDSAGFTDMTQSLWQIAPASAQAIGHPAPFPPTLVERLLRLYGWPGCTVLDPFAGAGTVGEVAVKLGANAILSDRSQKYCDLIQQRIGIHVQ